MSPDEIDNAVSILKKELATSDLANRLVKLSPQQPRHPYSGDFLMLKFIHQDLKTLEGFPPSVFKDQIINHLQDVLSTGMQYAETSHTLRNEVKRLELALAEEQTTVEKIRCELIEAKNKARVNGQSAATNGIKVNQREQQIARLQGTIEEMDSYLKLSLMERLLVRIRK